MLRVVIRLTGKVLISEAHSTIQSLTAVQCPSGIAPYLTTVLVRHNGCMAIRCYCLLQTAGN
ncbi:MAG: hypothetical protein KDF62_10590, partial [Nitrosomonas sp.]|nr:hypothetical protein [Nitrosomonas sp.]